MVNINRVVKVSCLVVLALFLILVIVFFLVQKKPKELDYTRMALVDKIGNNYIFRGNNPFVTKNGKKVFAYNELTSHFNDIINKAGYDLLPNYYLIDVNLLDLDEYYEIKKENKFFADNPKLGKIIHISTLSPSLLLKQSDLNITKPIIEHYNLWITDTLNKIHDIVLRQSDKPVVIYIHCNGGRDRTGFIIAAYKLLFENMNLAKARLQNITEASRNSGILYDNAIFSYCVHVKKTYNKPQDYCA